MPPTESERVRTTISEVGGALAPPVERELDRAYGPAWLEQVNANRAAEGRPPGRGLHDHRFVLAVVAYERALEHAFNDDKRQAARRLNGMANAVAHNDPLRAGDAKRANDMARRLLAEDFEPLRYEDKSELKQFGGSQRQGEEKAGTVQVGTLAGWGSRLAAILIDYTLVLVPVSIAYSSVVPMDEEGNGGIVVAIWTVSVGLYSALLAMRRGKHNGQTLGKQALGIRVAHDSGEPMTPRLAVVRELAAKTIGTWACIFTFGLLLLYWSLWSKSGRAIHDIVSSTHVVRV